MSATSSSLVHREFILAAVAITVLIAGAELQGHGNDKPRLTITSPRHDLTTTQDLVEVTVSLTSRHEPADTIVLMADGVEADRLTLDSPTDRLTHTFLVDLSGHPEGLVRLRARATRAKRKKTLAVAHSAPVRLRLDRDISDGVLVGPAGAQLTSADGRLNLSIPEGAVPRLRRLVVRRTEPANPETSSYEMLPHGLRFKKPVSVRLVKHASSGLGHGLFGGEPSALVNVSDGRAEDLANQLTEFDQTTQQSVAIGELTHFSDLEETIPGVFKVSASFLPTPPVVPVNDIFTATVHVEPSAAVPEDGVITILAINALEPVSPEAERVSTFYSSRKPFDVPFTFRCTTAGRNHLYFQVFFEPFRRYPGAFLKGEVFCTNALTMNGVQTQTIDGDNYRVLLRPVVNVRVVKQPPVPLVILEENGPPNVFVTATIDDLNPGVLSKPRMQEPPSSSRALMYLDGQPKLIDLLRAPGTARQTIEWDCLTAGETAVAFRFNFHPPEQRPQLDLLARIVCTPLENSSPVIKSSPPGEPVTPGTPAGSYFYQPEVFGLGTSVWELLLEGPGGTWTSQLPEWVDFDTNTGRVSGTPRADQAGTYRFRLTAREMDGERRSVSQDFTVTVTAPPPIPNSVIVPSLVGLIRGEAIDQILLVGLVLGNIIEIVDPLASIERVLAQTPLANTIAALGSAVDLLINVARDALPVEAPEGIHDTTTFNLPPGNRITIAGTNGFAIVDAITGETPSAGTDDLTFTGNGLGPFFGALVLTDPQGTGGDSIFAYGPAGTAMTVFDPVANHLGAWLVSARPFLVTDAIYFGGNPAATGALFVNFSAREIYPLVPVDFGASRGFTWQRPLADGFAFESAPAGPVSAFAWDLQFNSDASLSTSSPGRVLAVTDGSPGRIYVLNPATPSTPGVDLGAAGNSPRQLRCAPTLQLCVVSNFDSDSLTVVRWDGRTTASIVGSVPVGDGPVGIGIVADGTTARVISTGFNDHTYTVTRLAADGMMLSNDTQPAPPGCANPGHAIWLHNQPASAVLSCRTSNSFAMVTP